LAAARALARQKALATGLVVLCAMIFVGAKALEARHPAIAYVAAFAEAAIIGALADWYAVTALFRHPLGLKLPHTAIIAANQTRIAEAIGNFIAKHFLAGPRVGEKGQSRRRVLGDRFPQAGDVRQRLAQAQVGRPIPPAHQPLDAQPCPPQGRRPLALRQQSPVF